MSEGKRTKLTFASGIATVSLSYLLELMIALKAYREGLVIVGGWVPYLLLKSYQIREIDTFSHIGSKDIDIAVNPEIINETSYAAVIELLEERGYFLKEGSTYSYLKEAGEDIIEVDFLAPEYGGSTKAHRHQVMQDDFLARKAMGADIAFMNPLEFTLSGELPNSAVAEVTFNIANIVGILTMKGYALDGRYKEKDAYDIYSLVKYYKKGAESVSVELKPFLQNKLVVTSLRLIKEKFKERNSFGTVCVADFLNVEGEERDQLINDAHLQIQSLFNFIDQV